MFVHVPLAPSSPAQPLPSSITGMLASFPPSGMFLTLLETGSRVGRGSGEGHTQTWGQCLLPAEAAERPACVWG